MNLKYQLNGYRSDKGNIHLYLSIYKSMFVPIKIFYVKTIGICEKFL